MTMATYIIKATLFNGEHAEFRVKNPKWIRFQELRPSRSYSLLCIKKGRYRDHVSYRTLNKSGFGAGTLNPFNNHCKDRKGQFWIELYHDYLEKDGSESVKRLVIERRDNRGVVKICDLRDFRKEKYPESKVLDGFDTRLGPIYYNEMLGEYVVPKPEE